MLSCCHHSKINTHFSPIHVHHKISNCAPVAPFFLERVLLNMSHAFGDVFRYAKAGDVRNLKAIIQSNSYEMRKKDTTSCSYSAMHYAAANGHQDCITLLIEAGADVNATDEYGGTPLHLSSEKGFTDCISVLVAAGAHVNASSHFVGIPLRYAVANGHMLAANLLIGAGAEINSADKIHGNLSLHFATLGGHNACVKVLIKAGSAVNQVNHAGKTAMFLAAESTAEGSADCLRLLIMGKSDIDLKTVKGDSALHAAAIAGNAAACEILTQAGLDVNLQNTENQTPLHLAALHGHVDCMRALIHLGADVTMEDSYTQTPIDCIDDIAHRRQIEAEIRGK